MECEKASRSDVVTAINRQHIQFVVIVVVFIVCF